jgi:hypothetical protein
VAVLSPRARRPRPKAEANTYGLPRGESIRREQVRVFSEQRKALGRALPAARKDLTDPLLDGWPAWDDLGLGAADNARRMVPFLSLIWEQASATFASRVGLDPDTLRVVNPETERMIEDAALAFCDATNETTSLELDEALRQVRDELSAGLVTHGEALAELTMRVSSIFDNAESWRARRIAQTEAARAFHAANEQAAIASGVVTGWKWLLSSDACPMCNTIARRMPAARLGQAFAVIGDDPHYSEIRFPPAHPHCGCTVVQVLITDEQPEWGTTLQQPEPEQADIEDPNVVTTLPVEAPL